ncbi:MAG: 50S ribosomal protein L24 [Parachlamydiaceae bacterium]
MSNRTNKIRKDDTVFIMSGNSRGQSGKVIRIMGDRVVVQGANMRKRHVKPTRDQKGGIVSMERSIHVSNVKLSVDGAPVKLKTKVSGSDRELVYEKGGKLVTYRKLRK